MRLKYKKLVEVTRVTRYGLEYFRLEGSKAHRISDPEGAKQTISAGYVSTTGTIVLSENQAAEFTTADFAAAHGRKHGYSVRRVSV